MLRGIDLSSRYQQLLLFGIPFQSFCFRSVPHQFQMAHLLAVENLTAFTSCGRLTQLFFKLGATKETERTPRAPVHFEAISMRKKMMLMMMMKMMKSIYYLMSGSHHTYPKPDRS